MTTTERRFERELESLKTALIKMASVVEENVSAAVQALLKDQAELAKQVIANDERVNSLELENDNAVIDLLALQQPVASDLRFILAAQKINNDLERIGDHAVNIAESAEMLARLHVGQSLLEIPRMSEIARGMLKDAIDSFITLDPKLAQAVLERDDTVDDLNRSMTDEVVELAQAGKMTVKVGLELIRVSRNLERVADLTTNIAEEVIFHTQARVVKHHPEDFHPPRA
jgi:phosphate transport system protein